MKMVGGFVDDVLLLEMFLAVDFVERVFILFFQMQGQHLNPRRSWRR